MTTTVLPELTRDLFMKQPIRETAGQATPSPCGRVRWWDRSCLSVDVMSLPPTESSSPTSPRPAAGLGGQQPVVGAAAEQREEEADGHEEESQEELQPGGVNR